MKKGLIAVAVLALAGAGILAYLAIDPFADQSDPSAARHLSGSACERLAGLAGQLAEDEHSAGAFLAALGREGAGIRQGSRGLADLLRGGHDRIPGRGFRRRFDDDTDGQVRHFAGIATATLYAQGNPTRWISQHIRGDKKGSADDRLTGEGIAFAGAVLSGELPLEHTGDWLLSHLCRLH
ncbi:MAG: hypothetical protein ABR536_04320 [Solirubrobacterales bacterium]